ncbi:MAG: glycosyltransferase [Firmicutes bacterium]|nr:glycosyltransferase [Bacillota bacterium]
MNIALFSDTFPPEINGVATSTFNLFNVLRKNGHNVYAISTNPFSNKVEFKDNVLRVPGIELKRLYGYRMAGFFNSQAMRIIRGMKLDVIHIQTEAGVGIFGKIAARTLHVPTVYTYHTMYEDYTYYATKGHFDRIARGIVRWYSRFVAEQCTSLFHQASRPRTRCVPMASTATSTSSPPALIFPNSKKKFKIGRPSRPIKKNMA